jgi:glycosyltransferase involved in cell wall biosynthesis
MLKIAVVTPYYQELDDVLLQCHNSVLAQTHPCTHILVADGHAKPIFETSPRTLHLPLPQANADYGNTPRVIGALLADSYGFDAIAFLDADNWFEPVHLERMVAALERGKTPLVSCKRTFRHLDGAVLPCTELEEERFIHVDTNCWLITRPAFSLLPIWRIPKWAAIMGDRVFLEHARRKRFAITETQHRTVNYRTKYVNHYRLAGVPTPAGVYPGNDLVDAVRRLRSLAGATEMTAVIGFYPTVTLPTGQHAPAAPALVPADAAP